MIDIDYSDQAGSHVEFGDRAVTSFYTSYGVKSIESNYIKRIEAIQHQAKVKYVVGCDRVKEVYRDRKTGEIKECGIGYTDVERRLDPFNWRQDDWGHYIKVIWDYGIEREFKHGDNYPEFEVDTMMESPNKLAEDIKNNPHLHQKIKDNLLSNLKNWII